ncbi:elicitor-like transglutaminase, putative [Phytophthora infestans T30-4]|uniref:Elicitor-like transglutaminase, putative n=1 Tax=Phytophthora infestans (strain T30-4) TaxID=403677 RepID=D0NM50_PHYIT|nr:elicitor-like transglutaminase, putative [Phytophthora infestans T30-4]EEY60771.1 elicitor-like transglutaminase, putative [Phytophthora infestans T30-4]|eukprot:XP_002899717.1 elicitor-like transglutaminase, putative [Phytophthora infestans T30-4]
MLSPPPWKGYSLLALALLPSAILGEAIDESRVTPLGETAMLTHSHPAFGGLLRGKVVKPVVLTEQNGKAAVRNLEAQLSDVARLETFFGTTMESNFNVLKDSYATAAYDVPPWSGDFWPTYRDGINAVWKDGEASPAEKYAKAFDIDVNAFMNGISLSTGVLSESYTGGSTCSSDSDCDGGSLCGLRGEASNGFCIPTWYGLCHAWAAAAMYEAEPKCDVQKNNVTFHSVDMKALITQLYDGAAIEVVFTGARFNGPDFPEEVDKYGRYEDEARRDINAAFFHVAVANILGKQQHSFIVDCTTRLTWTVESIEDGALTTTGRIAAYTVYEDYEYCLELDENYTIIGGEWLGHSKENHPDFLWFPAAKPSADCVDVTVSPDFPDTPSTKKPGTDYTKSPSYTKTPSTKSPPTKSPPTKSPPTKPPTYPPETYAPETTAPATYPPETYSPETTAPSTYPPETYAPETTAPATYPPETYSPETTAPSTYPPETYAPETTAPATYPPETYSPETTAPSTYPPETYAPETTAPATYPPETYSPETTAPSTYPPETYAPETTAPATNVPAGDVLA